MAYALDEDGRRVVRALENPNWDWRTVQGIAEETGIHPQQVALILTSLPRVVDIVETFDKTGRPIYTTRKHYIERQSITNRILSVISDRIR